MPALQPPALNNDVAWGTVYEGALIEENDKVGMYVYSYVYSSIDFICLPLNSQSTSLVWASLCSSHGTSIGPNITHVAGGKLEIHN